MVAVIDYGVGNLFSLCCSLKTVGAEVSVVSDPDELKKADKMVLPGVGAFGDAAKKLFITGMGDAIKREALSGKPLLGICLGMQLLFDESEEYGNHKGLGLIPGKVKPLSGYVDPGMKIPHIGWNALVILKPESRIYKYINNGDHVYFVHSYHAAECDGFISSVTDYGGRITAGAENGNIYGCQFHPEKSGVTGLNILKAFCEEE